MQNQVTIVMCSRVGEEGDVTFAGRSVVVNSYGNVISEADGQERLIFLRPRWPASGVRSWG